MRRTGRRRSRRALPAARPRRRRAARHRAIASSAIGASTGSPRPAARARKAGRQHDAIEPGDLGLALVVELFAHPLADLARDLARVDRGARAPMQREQKSRFERSVSTAEAISGYCSLQASRSPLRLKARCTWPSEAAAAGLKSNSAKRSRQFGPSSACMRRRTNEAPIGGACDWSFVNSAAKSPGPRRGWSSASARPSSAGPSSSRRRKRAPWRPSRARRRAAD